MGVLLEYAVLKLGTREIDTSITQSGVPVYSGTTWKTKNRVLPEINAIEISGGHNRIILVT